MNRVSLVCLLFLFTIGCATTRDEVVNGQNLDQQLNAYIDDYYNQVVDQCFAIHGKASLGLSSIDCGVRGSEMHLSFPTIEYHNADKIYLSSRRMEANWCSAAQSKTGKRARWARHFRKENRMMSRPCFQGAALRRLLKMTAQNGPG